MLVTVSDEHSHTVLSLQQIIVEKYFLFCYSPGSPAVMPDLGEDYLSVYGYTQTHDTLELWLNIWRAYSADVVDHGTPPRA